MSVIAISLKQLTEMMEKLTKESSNMGLKLNFSKTKIMPIGPHAKTFAESSITILDREIEVVSRFEYLGRILDNKADDTAAVQHRIAKGWQIFQDKKTIITHRRLPMESKRLTYETYILPSVLYAAETITWSPALLKKMATFQNHIMRWMTGHRLNDRVPIARLKSMTQLKDITEEIKLRKLVWFGHLKRSSLPAKIIMEGTIPGNRKRGRPARRWIKDLTEWTGRTVPELCTIATDREEWRSLSHRS